VGADRCVYSQEGDHVYSVAAQSERKINCITGLNRSLLVPNGYHLIRLALFVIISDNFASVASSIMLTWDANFLSCVRTEGELYVERSDQGISRV
jgi:hypothetical protein